jgi:tRNA A-37 threonylcarbamoyl transferase component Bud32
MMARSPSEPLPTGTYLDDKYVVVRHIKTGGMGAVYEVEHARLGKRLAAKVLLPELMRRPALVERFRREARAASATGHENIVQVTDLGETRAGVPFLVMELLDGRTLGAALKEGRFAPERAVHVARQILSALEAAHARNIVHRDLKPENIFLVKRGNDPDFVKVLDFGIAKVLDDDDGGEALTETGQVIGTPSYMAPEQARGAAIDHRVDVYATGAMVYRMVTGQRPFRGDNFNQLIFAIAQGKPTPPRQLNPAVSEGLERVIARAMAVDPEARFPTARAFADALADDDKTWERGPARAADGVTVESATGSGPGAWRDRTVVSGGGAANAATEVRSPPRRALRAAGGLVSWGIVLGLVVTVGGLGWMLARRLYREWVVKERAVDAEEARRRVLTAPAPDLVSLDVRVEPAAIAGVARLYLDGSPVRAVELPKDGLKHTLRVEADGYIADERMLQAPEPDGPVTTPRSIVVRLRKKGAAPKPKAATSDDQQKQLESLIKRLGDEVKSLE